VAGYGWRVRPKQLADELAISAKALRSWLRRTHPRPASQRGSDWHLTPSQVAAARLWVSRRSGPRLQRPTPVAGGRRRGTSRAESDEAYVIDLCDEILGERALRQHSFGWLVGDFGRNGKRRKLPVDAYYSNHGLVVEYRERQHDQPVAHFDKPDVMTVSGVHRGEQRRIYDHRRKIEIPAHKLRLVIVTPSDLVSDRRGRLLRDLESDLIALRGVLRPA
jgi:hypothetical protein